MRRIDLSGEWSMRKAGTKKSVPASVPGCVHADLVSAAEIEDPFLRQNLEAVAWIGESEWVYEKLFVAEDYSAHERLALRFDGLSAGASVSLNDVALGRCTNVFEGVEFDVKDLVKPGKNKLCVTFPTSAAVQAEGLRIQASSLGAGAQPSALTAGIGRGVALLAFSGVRVRDVAIRQSFGSSAGVVGVEVSVRAEPFDPSAHLEVLVRVCYKGNILHEARDILKPEVTELRLAIKNPQLWWPAGLGDQPLYEVTVDVLSGRTCLEHISRRIGLRQFTIERDPSGGETAFRFWVNKHPFFLKGSSWLPADLYVARLTRVEYARLVKAAAVANINVLRVWGGGVYENDAFYDLCDEYGICIWHDTMLCERHAEEPTPAQRESFVREVQHQVRRLRHHPSLMAWCAGDPASRGLAAGYVSAAAETLAAHDPDRACLPPMRHAPFSLDGDPAYPSVPSYSDPCAVSAYLAEDERNIAHPVCEFHVTPTEGTKTILSTLLDDFLMPCGFDNTIWLSQIQQGLAIKRQFERVRLAERAPSGFVFWHLNDGWPTCSPSSLDHKGRWKALHYMIRRFFAPLWLCGLHQPSSGAVDVVAFNDGVKPFKGELQWRLTLMEGSVVAEGAKKVTVGSASRDRCASVKVSEQIRKAGAENVMLWMYLLDEQGNQVAWNFVLFCAPRQLMLQPPRMRAEIRAWDDNSFAVTLTSHRPALWVWLTLDGMDARFDDNFFCMEPEKSCRVRVTPAARIKLDHFRQIIRIGSLRDTWQEKRGLMQMMATPKK